MSTPSNGIFCRTYILGFLVYFIFFPWETDRRENLSLWKRHFCLAFKSGLVTYRNAFCIWANNIILSSAGNNWIGANTKLLNLFICILCIILSSFPKTWCLSTQYEVLHWELNCNSKRNSEPFHLHFHIHKYIKM